MMRPPPVTRSGQFLSIQYIRGFAAFAVVLFHIVAFNLAPPWWRWLQVGTRGVDVFFVISGFIMFAAARTEPWREFWRRRLLRIVPLYWIGTVLMFGVLWFATGQHPSGSETLASLLMVPRYSDATPTSINPILYTGWTLQYEMFFYLLFSVGLATRRVLAVPATVLIGAVLLGWALRPHAAVLVVVTRPLLLEFLAGLLIGRVATIRSLASARWLAWPALIALGVPALPGWAVGVAATALIAGAVGLEQHRPLPRIASLKLMGDASYALYLAHPLLISLTAACLARAGVIVAGPALIGVAGAMAVACLALGIAVHLGVERPLLRLGNRVWPGRRASGFRDEALPMAARPLSVGAPTP